MNLKKTILLITTVFISAAYMNIPGGKPEQSEAKLKRAFNRLSRTEWPLPGMIPVQKIDESNFNVLKLKNYLAATHDLKVRRRAYLRNPLFDKTLEEAVKQFQLRHGLEPDGIVGKKTLEEMNVPLEYRLNQLQANMERVREFPGHPGERYLLVNIPEYRLEYYENNEAKLDMNVVVGKLDNFTPVLHDTLTYIVFNPSWNVPDSIIFEEMIPEILKDPGYLSKNNYAVLKGNYNSSDTIDPADVDWKAAEMGNFGYKIVQLPGKDNSLGKMKFMFPNDFNIYFHDTPASQLFRLEKRAFSHGCIRLEKPFELAELLLRDQMQDREIKEILDSDSTENVTLNIRPEVHIVYQTAWIDGNGLLNFRDDIYNLDKREISSREKK